MSQYWNESILSLKLLCFVLQALNTFFFGVWIEPTARLIAALAQKGQRLEYLVLQEVVFIANAHQTI